MQEHFVEKYEDFETYSDLQKGKNIMANIKVRVKMYETGLKQWELAKLMGVSESVLSRKLRDELPEEEQEKIIELIEGSLTNED